MKADHVARKTLELAKANGQNVVLLNAGQNHVLATLPQLLQRHDHARIIGTYEPAAELGVVIADLDIYYKDNDIQLTMVNQSVQVRQQGNVKKRLHDLLREHIAELENDRQKCEQRIANLEQQITLLMEEK